MTTISWILIDLQNPRLTGGSKGGLPLIEATLAIADTNNADYFKLKDNELQVWAPRETPIQVSWSLPEQPLGKDIKLAAFTGVNLEPPPNGYPSCKEFPTSIVSSEPFCRVETCEGLELMVPRTPTLTVVNCNIAPEGSKPPYIYEYSIVFQGSNGQYYLFDPPIRNEY